MQRLEVTYQNPADLRPNPHNARRHSDKQIRQIMHSIRSLGFNNPVLVDGEGMILCGHGRVRAAIALGLRSLPTVRLDHLSEAQRRAFVIADNRLAELSGWDPEILAIELEGLLSLDCDIEITDTGFELPEVDVLIEALKKPGREADEAEQLLDVADVPAVARRGDLWLLGKHRLFCGDSLDPLSYEVALCGARADMVFTDPPYNLRVPGHVSGLGKAKHKDFLFASGEMSDIDFTEFLTSTCRLMADASVDGAIHFICIDWRHAAHLIAAGKIIYSEFKNLCCWVKSHGGMGALYRSQHELIGVFKVGKAPHVNNVGLGRYGRNRTNVWSYPGMNSFQRGRDEKLAMHPTVKPVALVADAMLDCSNRYGVILDPFAGSGTTAIAAERCGRRAALIELDPRYVDVALRRFCDVTGIEPVNAWTGARVQHRDRPDNAVSGELA